MRKQVTYLCHKLEQVKDTDLYHAYKQEIEQLDNNKEYQQLLVGIRKINKDIDRETYFTYKIAIANHEKQLRVYERDLNRYIKHMENRYRSLTQDNNLDNKKISRR